MFELLVCERENWDGEVKIWRAPIQAPLPAVGVPVQRAKTDITTPYCCISTLWVSRHHSLVGFYVNKQKRTFRKQCACLWFSWEH